MIEFNFRPDVNGQRAVELLEPTLKMVLEQIKHENVPMQLGDLGG